MGLQVMEASRDNRIRTDMGGFVDVKANVADFAPLQMGSKGRYQDVLNECIRIMNN